MAIRFPKNFPYGFEPHYYPDRLRQPWKLKSPRKIFVCSIADLFAPWTEREWQEAIITSMLHCPTKHIWQLLTKHPEHIPRPCAPWYLGFPDNFWIGATVTGVNDQWFIDSIKTVNCGVHFASFEPLLHAIDFDRFSLSGIDWVIVGKLTGSKRVKLDIGWVHRIEHECNIHGIPIFMKNNLGIESPRQEFPETSDQKNIDESRVEDLYIDPPPKTPRCRCNWRDTDFLKPTEC